MSQSIGILPLSVVATGAITRRRFVTALGVLATAAGNALGVSRTDAATGEAVTVDTLGTTEVEAGAAIAAGALVEVATGGKAVTKTAGVAVGRALEAATAAGDIIEVFQIPN